MKNIFKQPFIYTFFALEIFFALVAMPYLSGRFAYAPKSILYEGTFSASRMALEPMRERDDMGQSDFIMQERQFLRFFRNCLKNGELPFWNENIFGGLSQEDSMINSYISPFNIPWLLISNDHIAKGIQIFLLLNFGMLGFLWWSKILNLSVPWSILTIILGTITPLALHFQAHVHQPAIYYCGLYIIAAASQFLKERRILYLSVFFIALIMAIAINFLTIFVFISIFVFIVSVVHFIHSTSRREALNRIGILFFTYVFSLIAMSFFLAPIILESFLVRAPVKITYYNYAVTFLGAIAIFNSVNSAHVPFLLVVPFLIFVLLIRKKYMYDISEEIWILMCIWCFTIIITSFIDLQRIFRFLVPGMKYSNNALFRMLFLGNLFGILLMASLSERFSALYGDKRSPIRVAVIFSIFVIALLNGILWISDIVPILNTEKVYMTGAGFFISLLFLFFWISQALKQNISLLRSVYIQITTVLLIGIGYICIFQFKYPNLPVKLDPINHPIFSGLKTDRGIKAVTLQDCSSSKHSWYRFEATLAGFSTFDGPTDMGLFIKARRYWSPLNDIDRINEKGANLQEVNWICSEAALSGSGTALKPHIRRLFKMLGIKYLFTDYDIRDVDATKLNHIGELKVYELKGEWTDVSFLPDVGSLSFQDMIQGLINGSAKSIKFFDNIEGKRQELKASRISNIKWIISTPEEFIGESGTLFMNHPIEYHRSLNFPLTKIPMEGRWVISSMDSEYKDFPQTDVPFRITEVTLNERYVIKYDISHYFGWFFISVIGFVLFLILLVNERKRYGN